VKKEVNIADREVFSGLKFRFGELLWALHLLLVILVFSACQKPERNNPWDEKNAQNPQEWAPQKLKVEVINIVTRKITWEFSTLSIEGFKIDRKKGEEPWQTTYAILPKTAREWIDDQIVPDPELVYQYRVFAFAGDNISTKTTMTESAAIPAPANLQITTNSLVSVTLNWHDNSTGEEGFKIERKYEGGNWAEIASVTANSYHDSTFGLNNQVYYRIRAYYGSNQSSAAESGFNSQIPSPTNLQIITHTTTSISLSWNYTQTGHDGFRIDRKTDNGDWVIGFSWIDPDLTTYSNNTLNLEMHNYTFRINAYCGTVLSTPTDIQATLTIGLLAHGGIVFYLNGTGGGLVCAEYDQSAGALWGCQDINIGGTGTSIGTGASNTDKILAGCFQSEIAAKICSDLVLNGYNDWFLPSQDELNLMYQNLKVSNRGDFTNIWYWSSSESSSFGARVQDFGDGNQISLNKSYDFYVRAVRAF